MFIDPQRIYNCYPLWLDVLATGSGFGDEVKWGFSVVLNDVTKGTSVQSQFENNAKAQFQRIINYCCKFDLIIDYVNN